MGQFYSTLRNGLKVLSDAIIGGDLAVSGNITAPGVERMVKLGTVTFAATSGTAVTLYTLPAGFTLTQVICKVTTAFNAASTNVLILGTTDNDDAFMASGTVDESQIGAYFADVFETAAAGGTAIKAKYTQTGTAATAGAATFYGKITKLPA